jgi:hypothetical protein
MDDKKISESINIAGEANDKVKRPSKHRRE